MFRAGIKRADFQSAAKILDTYTSGCGRSDSPGALDSIGELGNEPVPSVGLRVGSNVGHSASELGELLSVVLGGLLPTEPRVLVKSALDCVNHCVISL